VFTWGKHIAPGLCAQSRASSAHIKLPGRPKKERSREGHEKPKATKLSKVGTKSKCNWCKGTTHNKRRCTEYKAHLAAQGGGAGQDNPPLKAPSQNKNMAS
jgi:hypothetical protein